MTKKRHCYFIFLFILLGYPFQDEAHTTFNNTTSKVSFPLKQPSQNSIKRKGIIKRLWNAVTPSQLQRFIGYMDHTLQAQAYWLYLRHHPIKRVLSKTPLSWATNSWKNEIDDHLKQLEILQNHLAKIFAHYAHYNESFSHHFDEYEKEIIEILNIHGVPLFYKRMWLPFTAGACALGAAFYYSPELITHVSSYWSMLPGKKKVMFECDATEEELHTIKNLLKNHSQFPDFNAVLVKGKAYITTNSNNALTVRTVLQNMKNYRFKEDLTLKDRFIYAWNIIKEYTIDPYFNAEYAYRQKLIINAQNVLNSKQYDHLFTPAERVTRKLSHERKNNLSLLKKIRNTVFNPLNAAQKEGVRRAQEILHTGLPKLTLKGGFQVASYQNPGGISQLDQSYFETLPSEMNYYGETAKFSLKALLGSYLLYKGTRYLTHATYNWFTRSTIAHPLKQDLIYFERILIRAQTESPESEYYNGMIFFFIKKLEAYLPEIPSAFENRFIQDKEDLKTSLSYQQKLSILHAMLRDYTFIHEKAL